MALEPANDPLLRPFHLRHLTLRNRLMSTAHEVYGNILYDGIVGYNYVHRCMASLGYHASLY